MVNFSENQRESIKSIMILWRRFIHIFQELGLTVETNWMVSLDMQENMLEALCKEVKVIYKFCEMVWAHN